MGLMFDYGASSYQHQKPQRALPTPFSFGSAATAPFAAASAPSTTGSFGGGVGASSHQHQKPQKAPPTPFSFGSAATTPAPPSTTGTFGGFGAQPAGASGFGATAKPGFSFDAAAPAPSTTGTFGGFG